MVFNVINNQFGLFSFLKRYGGAIQELIKEINGFTTKTSGVYNPVNYGYKWRNVKKQPYTTDAFEFDVSFPITVITKQVASKTFNLDVIKSMKTVEFIEELQISKPLTGSFSNPLTLSKSFEIDYTAPIDVMPWVKSKFSPKLRGIWTPRKVNIIDDVGTISEIEMLDIIGNIESIEDVELLNAI